MATRFMRVDLTDDARDFRPIALEPGVPLLDRSGANARILFRWLGGMVAEPVWEGESVGFFARDDHEGRLEEVVCQPATGDDLQKLLADDVAKLKERIANAKPETPTERMLKKMIRRSFDELTTDPNRTDLDCFFFRYRDAAGRWRLVWCPGYQRVDQEPAPSVVCTDQECSLLFVRRPGRSPKCPSCEAALATGSRQKKPRGKRGTLLLLLLLLIGGALFYWHFLRARLIVSPEQYSGPVDSRVEFKIIKSEFFSKQDVTHQVVGVVLDPAVVRFDQMAVAATLVDPGKTTIRFHWGKLTADVPVIAGVARNPDRLLIEPEKIDLAIGSTARPKVFGEYKNKKDKTKVDLTGAVEWSAEDELILFAYDGLLEGVAIGETKLLVRYRADAKSDYVAAEAEVRVDHVALTDVDLAIDPLPVALRRGSNLRIDAITKDKKQRYSVLESSRLKTEIRPQETATVEGRYLRGQHVGRGKLSAAFSAGPAKETEFEVVASPGLDSLTVTPKQLDMVVGQITDLSIVSPSNAPIRVKSSNSAVVEITEENRLIGRGEGKVEVEVAQGKEKRQVDVTVAKAEFASIAIAPGRIVVPVGRTVRARVLARIAGEKVPHRVGRRVEISPDLLTCQQRPLPRYADFAPATLALYGAWPTRDASPQTLAMRFGQQRASAPVDVILVPGWVAPDPSDVIAVRILSDQDQPVQFPVGAKFDDFYVEAEYPDGFTRLVTKKATLQTPQPPESAVLTASEGQLIGLRPGSTTVEAIFEGVSSKQPLQVDVTDAVDVDELRIAPAPAVILPGETAALDLVGYKNGRNVGIITGLGNIVWRSADPQIARVDGPSVTGMSLGQTAVTAELDGLQSAAAEVNVVDSIAEALLVDPPMIRLHVGQSVQIGTEVSVFRGQMEMSRQCGVTPALREVVEYIPQTHSLVGRAPGTSVVAFTLGDKLTNVMVEVLPGTGPINGQVIIEPAGGNLAIGQALDLRAYVVTRDGARFDRTNAAVFSSSDPGKVMIQGNLACAVGQGTSEITAALPDTENTGRAYVVVSDEPITELIVEPPQLALSTGDVARLRIMGRAASGTHLLFPQADLTVTAAGQDPSAIQIVGTGDVYAVRPGQAEVAVNWRPGNLSRQVHVSVSDNPLTDLRIEPGRAVIHPGQPLVYQVTGLRGGQRRVLGPADGVELFVGDRAVAEPVGDLTVSAKQPGRTSVVARLGPQQAEATLDVTAGVGHVGGDVLVTGPGGATVYGPGAGYIGHGGGYWVDGNRYWDGERWIYGPGYVEDVFVGPLVDGDGLRFVPEVLRLAPDSPPTPVRVFEVLGNGSQRREVTADPNLEIMQPPDTVAVEMTESGPVLRPTGQPGQTRVGAKLGTLMASPPLLVSVGQGIAGAARLVVSPDPLVLWRGETGTFATVMVDPGGGQPLRPATFKVTPAPGQDVVSTDDGQNLYGASSGTAQVVVSAVDPTGTEFSTMATVQVMGADPLTISPGRVDLQMGQSTPEFVVTANPPGGVPYQVPATLQSTDPNVLAPDPSLPGRFTARSFGETPVRAEYRGREAFATVTVTGKRFLRVTARKGDETDQEFDVILDVLADESEGRLEYRVYTAGETSAEDWQPAELKDGALQVSLRSGRIRRGARSQQYHLVLEARNPDDNTVQQYQYKFRLVSKVQEADDPATAPNTD